MLSDFGASAGCSCRCYARAKSCNLLNESCRNSLAHQLTAVTAEQITAACGMQPAQLLNQVGKLIAAIYPECDPALFTIYKRCGDYIKSKIL